MHSFNYECSLHNLPVMCFSENAQQSAQPCLQAVAAQQVTTHTRKRHLAAQKRHTGNAEGSPTKRLRHTAQTTTVQRRQRPTRSSSVLHSHSIVQHVDVEQAENQLEMSVEEVSQSAAPQSADVVEEPVVQPVNVEQAENQLEMSVEEVSQSAAESSDVVEEPVVQPVNVEQAENQLEMSVEEVSQSVAQSADVVGELAARQTQSVTAADLSPLPHADSATRVRSTRRTQGTLVLTSSPNVRELKEKLKMKEESKRRSEEKLSEQTSRRKKSAKVKLPVGRPKRKQAEATDTNRTTRPTKNLEKSTDSADASCIYCCEMWSRSKSRDSWIRCIACLKWAHCACAGVKRTAKTFQCDLC